MADDVTQDEEQDEAGGLTAMRRRADEATAAKAEAAAAKRELLFVKAGINTESAVGKLAFKAYDGELTSEAVNAFGKELGLLGQTETPPPPTPKVEITDEERALESDRTVLGGGQQNPATPDDQDPVMTGLSAFQKRLESGANRDQASGEVFDRLFDAAAKGNKHVIYNSEQYRDQWSQ